MIHYISLGISIILGVGGQILLKKGAVESESFIKQLFHIPTIIGLSLYVASALLYLIALRRLPVSIAFPSVSLSYVVVAVLGNLVFNEPLGVQQLAGILVIVAGVALLSW